jgi:membrane protein required for colicin V production
MLIDIVILFLILSFIAFGVMDGFMISVFKLAAWIFGILSIWLFSGLLASFFKENIEGLTNVLAYALGAFISFFCAFLLFRIAAAVAEHFVKKAAPLKLADRILGGGFGALKGIIISAIILSVVYLLPAKGSLKETIDNSISCSVYRAIPVAKLFSEFSKLSP